MNHPLLEIKNLSYTPQGLSRSVLNNINYKIYPGDFVILLGSNGSGKSSLLKTIDRRTEATTGDILLSNKKISHYSQKEFASQVITLTQNTVDSLFPSLTVLENCFLALERLSIKTFLNQQNPKQFFSTHLKQFNNNLAHHFSTHVSVLSGGEQQALVLALSMLHPPKLLLLDEHVSALDPKAAEHLLKFTAKIIDEHKITCVLTTHDLKTALRFGNRLLALSNGKVSREFNEKEKKALTQEDLLNLYLPPQII
ncbi:MAG: ATP-binding cassette domain-containing protein [Gammaproteobacteria bacterium]